MRTPPPYDPYKGLVKMDFKDPKDVVIDRPKKIIAMGKSTKRGVQKMKRRKK